MGLLKLCVFSLILRPRIFSFIDPNGRETVRIQALDGKNYRLPSHDDFGKFTGKTVVKGTRITSYYRRCLLGCGDWHVVTDVEFREKNLSFYKEGGISISPACVYKKN